MCGRVSSACHLRPLSIEAMKFRFVLVDPEDEEGSAPSTEPPTKGQSPRSIKYEQSVLGMVRVQRAECRSRVIPLTNFNARIVADRIVDDGDEEHREFELEVELGKQTLAFTVSAAEFPRMAWVAVKVGPQAIVYPGQQQHARAAIQSLSGEIRQERIFAHLGWKKDGSRWLYLRRRAGCRWDHNRNPGTSAHGPAVLPTCVSELGGIS